MNALFRILGNDLPPRHEEGQTIRNVEYILKNEPHFPATERIWILNRIVCPEQYYELNRILKGETVCDIPINWRQFKLEENKAHYLTNVNASRNYCLDLGFGFADTVFPLDGNCFFEQDAFNYLSVAADYLPYHGYFAIPMSRNTTYDLKKDLYENWGSETSQFMALTEPQLAFTKEYDLRFALDAEYGKMSKAELLIALQVQGVWLNWAAPKRVSKFTGKVTYQSFVHRLPSGNEDAEKNVRTRATTREDGLKNLVDLAWRQLSESR